jgi:hypothetical protein
MKKFILSEHKEDKSFLQYVRYYETMLQNEEMLRPLLDDLEHWRLDIIFRETNEYGYGKYELYLWDYEGEEPDEDDDSHYGYDQKSPTYRYEIELERDERYWGYCECTPGDNGYDEKHKCCGNGCDWVAPAFTLRKIEERSGSFKGQARDIWKLEEKWEEHLNSYNEKIKQERLKRIEDDLERLQKEKDSLSK